MRFIHRKLVYKKSFWGLVRMTAGGWRFGTGCGFLEWGKGSNPGLWLPRKDAQQGKPKDFNNIEGEIQ